jgi:hypothetical protein
MGVEPGPEISTAAPATGEARVASTSARMAATIAAPYSLRPLPGAPAPARSSGARVTPRRPARFTLETLPVRFDKMDDALRPVPATAPAAALEHEARGNPLPSGERGG